MSLWPKIQKKHMKEQERFASSYAITDFIVRFLLEKPFNEWQVASAHQYFQPLDINGEYGDAAII